jgi:adenylate kinase family enzyme
MKTVHIPRGIPASGKSTWSKNFIASRSAGTVARINNDDIIWKNIKLSLGIVRSVRMVNPDAD